jgi:hypothetical protein
MYRGINTILQRDKMSTNYFFCTHLKYTTWNQVQKEMDKGCKKKYYAHIISCRDINIQKQCQNIDGQHVS